MSQQANIDPRKAIVGAVVLILFFFGFIAILISIASSRSSEIPFTTFVFSTLTQAVGALIAILASLVLLGRAVVGAGATELTPLLFPFLAGLALASSHWGGAIALGALGVTAIVKEIQQHRKPKPNQG